MRHILTILALLLTLSMSSNAKGRVPRAIKKEFNRAYRKHSGIGSLYYYESPGRAYRSKKHIERYCRQHDLLDGSYNYRTTTHFGAVDYKVSSMSFVPRRDMVEFTFANLAEVYRMPRMKNASGIVCTGVNGTVYTTQWMSDILWDEKLIDSNGRLNGTGKGYKYDNGTKTITIVSGTFKNGIPVGDVTYGVAGTHSIYPRYESRYDLKTRLLGSHYYVINREGYDYLYETSGKYILCLKEIVKELDNRQILGIHSTSGEVIYDQNGKFVGLSQKQKDLNLAAEQKAEAEKRKAQQEYYDAVARSEAKARAERLDQVDKALALKVKSSYLNKTSLEPSISNADLNQVESAIELCQKYSHENSRYKSDASKLQTKKNQIQAAMANTRKSAEWKQAVKNYNARQQRRKNDIDSDISDYEHRLEIAKYHPGDGYQYIKRLGEYSRGRVFDRDDDYTDHRTVYYEFPGMYREESFGMSERNDHYKYSYSTGVSLPYGVDRSDEQAVLMATMNVLYKRYLQKEISKLRSEYNSITFIKE